MSIIVEDGRGVLDVTVNVGFNWYGVQFSDQEVKIRSLVLGQPIIAFRGASRVIIFSTPSVAGQQVVRFQPIGDGSTEMRFEGIVYSLARAFAMPLADGQLREIRTQVIARDEGTQLIHGTILMDADLDEGDRRRIIIFQDVREKQLLREPFSLRSVESETRTVFSYITPDKRYTYERIKSGEDK